MKLHSDKDSFEAILLEVEQISGVRADILEKDYYVTLLLEELAGYQSELKAYFKGGTALYKALGSIRRFSEDSLFFWFSLINIEIKNGAFCTELLFLDCRI